MYMKGCSATGEPAELSNLRIVAARQSLGHMEDVVSDLTCSLFRDSPSWTVELTLSVLEARQHCTEVLWCHLYGLGAETTEACFECRDDAAADVMCFCVGALGHALEARHCNLIGG